MQLIRDLIEITKPLKQQKYEHKLSKLCCLLPFRYRLTKVFVGLYRCLMHVHVVVTKTSFKKLTKNQWPQKNSARHQQPLEGRLYQQT